MTYTTDTHALVWYFTDDSRLSNKGLEAFESSREEGIILVPAVVLAEIMFIAKKGKITLNFKQTLEMIKEYENFCIVPLDVDILREADSIEADLEMHDKLILATALYFDASLITKDSKLKSLGIVKTIW